MHTWVVEACLLAADAALVLLFYKLYKSKTLASDLIKSAESLSIDENLETLVQSRPDRRVAYAHVRGTVQPADYSQLLTSKYSTDRGVIRRWTLEELKSKYADGSWSDYSDVVKSSSEEILFCLRGNVAGRVSVEDASRAIMLDEAFATTYDHYTSKQTSVVGTVVDRLAGHMTKGLHERERMLKVGTSLLGFGELALEQGELLLRAPADGASGAAFVLTNRSKAEVIHSLRDSASVYRTLAILFGAAGALWLGFSLARRLRKLHQNYRQHREMRLLREAQSAAAASAGRGVAAASADASSLAEAAGGDGSEVERAACVVCLVSPRAVVNMDCRHVCSCIGCYEAMPAPKRCPVCRETISSVIPIYMP